MADLEIERLVDAFRRVVWSNGYGAGGGRPSDLADSAEAAARTALLDAIRAHVASVWAEVFRAGFAAADHRDSVDVADEKFIARKFASYLASKDL